MGNVEDKLKAWSQAPSEEVNEDEIVERGVGYVVLADGTEVFEEDDLDEAIRQTNRGVDRYWDDTTTGFIEHSCAFFAQEILQGPPEPPYSGRFLIGEHHEQWDDLLVSEKRLCINAPRDHGKCQRGDALVLTPSGARVRLDEWAGGLLWAYDPESHEIVPAYAPASRPNGVKRVLRVTTRTGRQVEVTENHPLRLWDRWERADQLQVGQRIGVPRKSPEAASGEVSDAWLIGLLVGDGGLTDSNVVLTTSDQAVLEGVKRLCEVRPADALSYRLPGQQGRMRELGLMGKTATEKRVPEAIYTSLNDSVAEFLAGYFDADAHVNPYGGGSVEFYSVSEYLLRDVQHLLTRLGVVAVLSPKKGRYRGAEHLSWRLTVRGRDLVTLNAWIRPRGARGAQLMELAKAQNRKKVASGDAIDRLPAEVWSLLRHSEDWFRRRGHSRPTKQYAPTRQKVLRVARAEGNRDLLRLVDSPVLWDEIVAIEDIGEHETWSIHVPGLENYLSDDVINHNTFFFTFAYPLWKAALNPGQKGFIFSATRTQAERILDDIRNEIETNPNLQWLVPAKKDRWSGSQLRLSNGHTIYARGFGTKVRGAHPNWIVIDDGLNDESAYSETRRTKEVDYFYTAITNMVVPGGQIVVVGCVTGDTWIPTEKGLRKIQDLMPEGLGPKEFAEIDLVLEGLDGPRKAVKFWNNGQTETIRATLKDGIQLEGSHRHPVWVMGTNGVPEWKRFDALAVGDYVAVRVGTERWGTDLIGPDEAYLMGLFTGDGSCEEAGRFTITTNDPQTQEWLKRGALGLAWREGHSPMHWRASSKSMRDRWKDLGVVFGRAPEKVLPRAVIEGSRATARAFLQGLFDADGCYYKPQHQVVLAQTSEHLARDVQQLLLNFGVHGYLKKKPTQKSERCPGATHPMWWIVITGRDCSKFCETVGFRLKRKQPDALPQTRSHAIPNQQALVSRARKEKPRISRGQKKWECPVNLASIGTGVDRLREAHLWLTGHGAVGEATDALAENLHQTDAGIRWVPVTDLVHSEAQTYDFIVEGDHSFVSNGVVSHNTPFHKMDLYGVLKANEEYCFRQFPAISKSGKILWADRYDKKYLEKRRREIGSIRFSREFLCEPVADDMSLFPVELFKGDPVEVMSARLGAPLKYWQEIADLTVFMGVDLAISSNIGADYTVIWTMGVDDHKNRWLLDIVRMHGKGFQEQLSEINRVARKYDPAKIFIEANQMQQVFGKELKRTTDLPVQEFVTTAAKNKLDKGVPSLRVLLENKKLRIPRGDQHSVEMTDLWIEEMHNFTYRDGKLESVGAHDDTVMAFWICDQAIRSGHFSFSFGEEFSDEELTHPPESDEQEQDTSLVDPYFAGAPLPHQLIRGY